MCDKDSLETKLFVYGLEGVWRNLIGSKEKNKINRG